MKKIAIIGSGSGASLTAVTLRRFFKDQCEIEIYHDSKISIEPVGQATLIPTPQLFFETFEWTWHDNPVKARFKTGATYENWGKKNHNFFHGFPMNVVGMHFIPSLLSDFLLNCGLFKVTEKNIQNPEDEIDADWIYDCRGRSELNYEDYHSMVSPLNSVLLGKTEGCDLDLHYTRCVATPDGWTFIIPNHDSVSYGYLYNDTVTTAEEAGWNFKKLFGIVAKKKLSFKNYRAKSIWAGNKTILNGNRFGFIEPLEATSMAMYQFIAEKSAEHIFFGASPYDSDRHVYEHMKGIENFLMWHYRFGSKYDSAFWDYAKTLPFEMDAEFQYHIDYCKNNSLEYILANPMEYSQWNSYNILNWLDNVVP
tara:strand:+ start:325 stop:1422 length:1098 start_codon:yes stop_codon:yes gene_type:complete